MKNKIFFIGLKNLSPLEDLTEYYYQLDFFHDLEEWMTCQANALFIHPDLEISNTYDFNGKIHPLDNAVIEQLKNASLKTLDKLVGRRKLVNPKQFQIIRGSVVQSKVDRRLKSGIVDFLDKDNVVVHFPLAKEFYGKTKVICHLSTLRVITHIEELKRHEHKEYFR